ncbi:MAG: alpha-amylase family glycosyl hydrolase, partial [Acutalibacteraceae bacterium]
MFKKATSVLLCACMIASYMAVGSIPVQAAEVETQESKATINYGLTSNVQQGQILQCWNWSYKNIAANMEKIASQGFSAIQTSPITPSNCESDNHKVADRWWTFYQPTNFEINNKTSNGLGTKADFIEMCEVAHSYGVKVVVDAVLNHMASQTTNDVCLLVPSEIRNNSALWHNMSINISNYENRYDATQHCMDGLPDLNTANKTVQNYAIKYLKECIDAGADGFRFDAAKHIETSYDEASFASDYWKTVLPAVTAHAKSTRNITPYYYGETLGNLGGGSWAGYTDYMSITDDGKCNDIRAAVKSGNGAGAAASDIGKGVNPTKALHWVESHDTYIDGTTKGMSTNVVNQMWAVVGTRNQVCGMYFARPNNPSTTMIGDADVTGWANAEVKAVNQFKNHFAGQSEYLSSNGSVAYNERGTSGVVIVNCNGGSKNVSLKANKMANGTYKDAITGNTFTVSGGYINGNVGSTGIAVVYNASSVENPTTPTSPTAPTAPTNPSTNGNIYFTPSANWKDANARFSAYFFNGSSEATWVSLTKNSDGKYSAAIPAGNYKSVIFVRMNPNTSTNDWESTNKWNQTADLTISGNYFTLTSSEWDNGNGTWTTINEPTAPVTNPVTDPVTTPVTNPVTDPVTNPVTNPVTDPVTTPVTDPVTTPVTDPVTNPVSKNTIYFVPSANWKDANARFSVYFFNGSSESTWVSLTKGSDGKYSGTI